MKWTKEEEKNLIELLRNKKSYMDISIILNRTKRSIKEKVNKLGFSSKTFSVSIEKIKCLNCEKGFEISVNDKRDKNRKFCSSSCSATFNNKQRTKEVFDKISESLKNPNLEKSYCIVCGEENNKKDYKYCSSKCQLDHRYTEYIKMWKDGNVDGMRGEYGISQYIRKYLTTKYDDKCTKCGWSETNTFTKKIPLEIEHIDGDSKNNKEENLTLLCPNCHSLTKTYKGANRGNGRHNRRERYKNGQSY
jgi:predicted nucleic acid-binding Zn ribbon protein